MSVYELGPDLFGLFINGINQNINANTGRGTDESI